MFVNRCYDNKEMIDNKVEILNNSVSIKKRYDEIIDFRYN